MKRRSFIREMVLLSAAPALLLPRRCAAQITPAQLARIAASGAAAASYTAKAATFDGTNDYLQTNATSTGIASADTVTFSVWLDFQGGDSANQDIFYIAASRSLVRRRSDNKLEVLFVSLGGTTQINAISSVTKVAADGWFHFYFTATSSNSSLRKMYFDGVEDTSVNWVTYQDTSTMQLAWTGGTPAARIGAGVSALNKLNAHVAELYHSNRYLDDVTKFRNASTGKPVSLGSDGSLPDGTKPGIYFSAAGDGDAWNSDSANGNAFSLTGALGSPTPP